MFNTSSTTSTTEERLSTVRLQTSSYGRPIPMVYGRTRVSGNLLWYGNFIATPHTTTTSSGGKGGPGGVTQEHTSFTYSAAFIFGLGHGPATLINQVYNNKSKNSLAVYGFTAFLGTYAQNEWGFISGYAPSESLRYRGEVYVAASAFQLGEQSSLPNLSFDVTGKLPYAQGSIDDANPKDMIVDFLTDPYAGAGWGAGQIADLTTYSNYCRAYGLFLSVEVKEQRPAAEWLAEWAGATNTQIVWSEGKLKLVPYGDKNKTGNGATYTAPATAVYALTDDDFLVSGKNTPPIEVMRRASADAVNHVRVEFLDRSRDYNIDIEEAKDQANIEVYGLRPLQTISLHCIADRAVANTVANLILQRALYVRNEYKFRLGWRFVLLEPGDLLSVTDTTQGILTWPVRVVEVEEDEDGTLTILAEDYPGEVSSTATYATQTPSGFVPNYNVAPGNVNAPVIFEPTISLAETPQIWIVTSGGVNWGGADVWLSFDNANYRFQGRISGKGRHGVLSQILAAPGAEPDVTNTLRVDLALSTGQLISGSQSDVDQLRTLCWVEATGTSDGELIAYRDAALVSGNTYDLTYLRRGKYGSVAQSHASGKRFVRLDQGVFVFDYTEAEVGRTVYIKLLSYNVHGLAQQTLADVSAYTYVIQGLPIEAPGSLVLAQPFVDQFTRIKWDSVVGAKWYEVEVSSTNAGYGSPVVERTVKTTDPRFTYSYQDAYADGGPFRYLRFRVRAIGPGAVGGYSSLNATNAPPAAPSGLTTSAIPSGIHLAYTKPADTDFAGTKIWGSTSIGFTPNDGTNLLYDGPDVNFTHLGLTVGVARYYRVAAYDTFGKTVAELNLSTETSAIPASVLGSIEIVTSLPAVPAEGKVVYLTTDDKLYRSDGVAWVTWTDGSDLLVSSVTSGKISVSTLSAIAANLGSITAGNFTLDTSGYIKGGATAYLTGTGFWLGYASGAYKMHLGNPAGNYFSWDGSALTVKGTIQLQGTSTGYANISDKPTDLSGINAGEGTKLGGIAAGATVGADWSTNLSSRPTSLTDGRVAAGFNSSGHLITKAVPAVAAAPSGAGLYLGSDYLGYYSGAAWRAYIQSNGTWYFGDGSANYITWNGTTLTVGGDIIATGNIKADAVITSKVGANAITAPYSNQTTAELTVTASYADAASFTAAATPVADATVIDITCACDWKMNSGGTGDHMFRLYNSTTSTVIWESYALKAAAGDGGSFSKTYQAALSASFAYVFKFQVKVSVATTFDKVKNRSITGVILKR